MGCVKEANTRCSPGGNFPAAFAQPEIIFYFISHPQVSHPGERRKVSQGSLSSSPFLTVCQRLHHLPLQHREKAPTLSCLAHVHPIPAGTSIPSLWGHPIPRRLHPASSPREGQKGTSNPGPQAGLQGRTSPQQLECCVCGHSKACKIDGLPSEHQGITLNTSPGLFSPTMKISLIFSCIKHDQVFSISNPFREFLLFSPGYQDEFDF